ncbi:hypothetical protein BN381_230023 [Candidatus Microthrix parvicella RN1]|uniref:Uncharacterized protein n=1 Tax=Candidatus Neomicrothrix parvicella RN1 TaxID=1229780 RepID=R4YYM9_9ACTN|nr:hypothetical protein BN381_230023 [Candidatus Microthrix parvicella RN1]
MTTSPRCCPPGGVGQGAVDHRRLFQPPPGRLEHQSGRLERHVGRSHLQHQWPGGQPMIAGLSLGSDARRYFHFSLPRLAIVTVIQMPLLYDALYLWTFWNPFGGVDEGEDREGGDGRPRKRQVLLRHRDPRGLQRSGCVPHGGTTSPSEDRRSHRRAQRRSGQAAGGRPATGPGGGHTASGGLGAAERGQCNAVRPGRSG